MTRRLYSVATAASMIGVAVSTLYRWVHLGSVHVERAPGGQLLVPASEIERLRGLVPEEPVDRVDDGVACGCFGDQTRPRG